MTAPAPCDAPLVTAIVSTYASERFMAGCLDNLAAQTVFDRMEVIVVDAASPENERAIVEAAMARHPNIKYIRTDARIGIYAAWNIGIRMARGKYLTNANTDDRRVPEATERLIAALEANPDAGLAYSDLWVTDTPNGSWDTANRVEELYWLPYDHLNLLRACQVGPVPVWRAEAHRSLGLFDESYVGAGDYDFWLRLSEVRSFVKIEDRLGLYLRHEGNLETANLRRKYDEEWRVREAGLGRFLDQGVRPELGAGDLRRHLDAFGQALPGVAGWTEKERTWAEYHLFSMAVLLARLGRVDEAVGALAAWLTGVHNARRMGHLLAHLLLRLPAAATGEAAGPRCGVVLGLTPGREAYLPATLAALDALALAPGELTVVHAAGADPAALAAALGGRPAVCLALAGAWNAGWKNLGLEALDTPLACLLEPGDLPAPGFLAASRAALAGDPTAVAACPSSLDIEKTALLLPPDDRARLVGHVPPAPGTAVLRRAVWRAVGPFRTDLPLHHAWEFWLRAAAAGHGLVPAPQAWISRRELSRPDTDARERIERNRIVRGVR